MSAQNLLWKIYFPRCITTKKIDKMFRHSSSLPAPSSWSALDDTGLVSTAGALILLDVLIIGGQDGLQLLLEGVRLHFGVCIDHRVLVLKYSCIDAVIKSNRNTVDDESMDVGKGGPLSN